MVQKNWTTTSSLLQVKLQPPACGAFRPGWRGLRSALSPACLHCTNPVGASLSRELFVASLKSSRASSLLQVQLQPPACGVFRPGRRGLRSALSPACLHCTNPVGASLSRELFAASLKSSRASSLLQVQLQPRACGAFRPGRRGLRSALSPACLHCTNPVGASLSRELFAASLNSSLLQVSGEEGYSPNNAFCPSGEVNIRSPLCPTPGTSISR